MSTATIKTPVWQVYSCGYIEATIQAKTPKDAAERFFAANPQIQRCEIGTRSKPSQYLFNRITQPTNGE